MFKITRLYVLHVLFHFVYFVQLAFLYEIRILNHFSSQLPQFIYHPQYPDLCSNLYVIGQKLQR